MGKTSAAGSRRSTQVGIIGGGPAGMLLGNVLLQAGIDCVVMERLSRDEVYRRAPRAGLIEHRTVELLAGWGLADHMRAAGRDCRCCEFRADGHGFLIDYAELCGGPAHWVYPQHELVADLTDAYLKRGGEIRFSTPAAAIEDFAHPAIVCREGDSGREIRIDCEFVAGCDGFHGISRASLPEGSFRAYERHYPFQWLTIPARVPPPDDHTIYALHPRGFAGHMLRSATQTRFYLQVPLGSTLEEWPAARVWSELRVRLARDGWTLTEGPLDACSFLELRSYVTEPMQHERLFLVGDAAHIVTPAGGKGTNLALQDAAELALGLREWYARGDGGSLAGYSAACLPRVWRCQEFSNWMISVMHTELGESPDDRYGQRLRQARLEHLRTCRSFAINFAENYVGVR